MWSVTKTCPIYSEYNGYWYFYEDFGGLVPKWLHPTENNQTTDNYSENRLSEYNALCMNLRQNLEQAYKLGQQLENYNWSQYAGLSWTTKSENGIDQSIAIDDLLPSPDMEKALLTQCDKCNAVAVKLWAEYVGKDLPKQRMNYLAPAQLRVLQQLIKELGKAKHQATQLRSATDNTFAEADKNLSSSSNRSYNRLARLLESDYTKYAAMLDDAVANLDQAEQLALKLNRLRINVDVFNLP